MKLAPPKSKYVEHILLATQSGDAGVAEVFRTLTHRLRDSTWTVAFKSLIIVHLMIKEGAQDVTLRYLAVAPRNRLAINNFTDVQTQGQNIRVYSEYLLSRAMAFEKTKCDHVRAGEGRMKRLSVDKGLLRETEVVQDQIKALVKCDLLNHDTENEISLTAFRLLTRDLLDLYNVENEAVMNVLSRYFEMSRPDAERAIRIYKVFCKQTDQVVQYLSVARQYEYATRLEIPKLKHAPTSLAASLQEYLDDKDFEINRRQYLAEQDAAKDGKPFSRPAASKPAVTSVPKSSQPPAAATTASSQQTKGPAPDLIDFFSSIEQNQSTMQTNPFLQQQQQQQSTAGFEQHHLATAAFQQPVQQSEPTGMGFLGNGAPNNPYQQQSQQPSKPQPLQAQFTGAGFGGYGPQPAQEQQSLATGNAFAQNQQLSFASPAQAQPSGQLQSQTTNPFRQSMMITGGGASLASTFAQQQPEKQANNPFARSAVSAAIPENGPSPPPQQYQSSPFPSQTAPQIQPIQAQPTGTNPFARNLTPSQQPTPPISPANGLQVQPTGSTNPFRQSMFVNQQTGTGWQNTQQGTIGGLQTEQVATVPVFPRPGQVSNQQQQQSWGQF